MVQERFGLIEGILTFGWGLNSEMDGFRRFLKMKISNRPEVYRILNATIKWPICTRWSAIDTLINLSHLQIILSRTSFGFSDCSVFQDNAEMKDNEPQNVVVPDDEVAQGEYFTIPPMQKVASAVSVPDFVISRKEYGSISFKVPVDLTAITSLSILQEIVEIDQGRVVVYPNESNHSPKGTGLNMPAKVMMENLWQPANVDVH